VPDDPTTYRVYTIEGGEWFLWAGKYNPKSRYPVIDAVKRRPHVIIRRYNLAV